MLEKKEKIRKRTVELANFNCVFGDTNEPLLSHFTDILYPAFTSLQNIRYSDGYFSFDEVKIIEHSVLGIVLTGIFIKQTELEILSQKDHLTGKLIFTNQKYQTAPYSVFSIFLKNHRMIFYKNQKGSPRLSTFQKISEKMISNFLAERNKDVDYKLRLPGAHITILPLPSRKNLKEQLSFIKKIDSVEYKLTPLNGDNDYKFPMQGLLQQLNDLDSKQANLKFTNPSNKEEVINQIEQTRDLAKAKVIGYTNTGNLVTITEKNFAEKVYIDLPINSSNKEILDSMYTVAENHAALLETSDTNEKIYQQRMNDIKSLMR